MKRARHKVRARKYKLYENSDPSPPRVRKHAGGGVPVAGRGDKALRRFVIDSQRKGRGPITSPKPRPYNTRDLRDNRASDGPCRRPNAGGNTNRRDES